MESNNESESKPLLLSGDEISNWTPPVKSLTNALQTLTTNRNESIPSNSRFLFIAVSKFYNENQRSMDYEDGTNSDYNAAINAETSFQNDFNATHLQEHVSQLDPNMSSTAQYSPVYVTNNQQLVNETESSNSSNPIIILPSNTNESNSTSLESTGNENGFSLNSVKENIDLLRQVVSNPLCQPLETESGLNSNDLKQEDEHVELLITDHNTGISYALTPDGNDINEQNDISRMLEKLESNPIRLLENQNLVLDLNTISQHLDLNNLETNLSQTIPEFKTIGSSNMVCTDEAANLNTDMIDDSNAKELVQMNEEMKLEANDFIAVDFLNTDEISLRRSKRNLYEKESDEDEDEDDIDLFNNCVDCVVEGTTLILCSRHRMLSISDKPVPSRARATLPASYLSINKVTNLVSGETVYGVFAKKMIPKRTQFGPIEGILLKEEQVENFSSNNGIELLLEGEDGVMHKLDTNDENLSNWMRFVRKADNARNQNLILNQMGPSLYYISTCCIAPRQELLVGYSPSYAEKRKLPLFSNDRREVPQNTQQDQQWPCYECNMCLNSSDELLKHLSVHDSEKISIKKGKNRKPKVKRLDPPKLERGSSGDDDVVSSTEHIERDPLSEKENLSDDILNYKRFTCTVCKKMFEQFQLLSLHMFSHQTPAGNDTTVSSSSEEQVHVCPRCGFMLPTRQELIVHVDQHSIKEKKTDKCHLCYKCFASPERLQRHMLVHGSEESKPLQCTICSKRFLNNSALTCHIKTHRMGKQTFECPICKESFEQVLLHREHVRTHCIDGIYKCPQCPREFKEYRIIRKHIRAFHCDRKHGCLYCCKEFPTTDKLRMHLLKHSDHREFLCAICGQQFKRKDKLQEHTKRMHLGANAKDVLNSGHKQLSPSNKSFGVPKKFMPKVSPTDYHRFIYKCHCCLVGFKRRGMLVNHLAKRHPDIPPDSVPELNLPILRTTRDYYCQYCDKVYKSSSKRKAHILKNHPGAALPASNRSKDGSTNNANGNGEGSGTMDSTYSQTVGSITTNPHNCQWCHKQYASKAKLLQHQRKKHFSYVLSSQQNPANNEEKIRNMPSVDVDLKDSIVRVEELNENKKIESTIRNSSNGGEEGSEFLNTDGFDSDILLTKSKELNQESEEFASNDILNEEVSNADLNVYRNLSQFRIDRIIPITCANDQNATSSSQTVATSESTSASIPPITESMLHSLLMGSNTSVTRQWIETTSSTTFSPPYPPH